MQYWLATLSRRSGREVAERSDAVVGRRVAAGPAARCPAPRPAVGTEQRQELAAKPAPEEVVRHDVDRRVEQHEEVGRLVEGVQRQVGERSRRVVSECPDDARHESRELTDDEDDHHADQHHRRVDTPRHGGRRPRHRRRDPRHSFQLVGGGGGGPTTRIFLQPESPLLPAVRAEESSRSFQLVCRPTPGTFLRRRWSESPLLPAAAAKESSRMSFQLVGRSSVVDEVRGGVAAPTGSSEFATALAGHAHGVDEESVEDDQRHERNAEHEDDVQPRVVELLEDAAPAERRQIAADHLHVLDGHGKHDRVVFEELGDVEDDTGDDECGDDATGAADRAEALGAERVTDHDVAVDGEGQRQPDGADLEHERRRVQVRKHVREEVAVVACPLRRRLSSVLQSSTPSSSSSSLSSSSSSSSALSPSV